MEEPGVYFSQASYTFFALGVALVAAGRLFEIRLTDLLSSRTAFHAGLVLSSLIVAGAMGRFLMMQTVFADEGFEGAPARLARNFRSLGVGMLVGFLILVPVYKWLPLGIIALAIIVGPRVLSYVTTGISIVLVLTLKGKYFRQRYLPLIYGIIPFVAVLVLQESFLQLTLEGH